MPLFLFDIGNFRVSSSLLRGYSLSKLSWANGLHFLPWNSPVDSSRACDRAVVRLGALVGLIDWVMVILLVHNPGLATITTTQVSSSNGGVERAALPYYNCHYCPLMTHWFSDSQLLTQLRGELPVPSLCRLFGKKYGGLIKMLVHSTQTVSAGSTAGLHERQEGWALLNSPSDALVVVKITDLFYQGKIFYH